MKALSPAALATSLVLLTLSVNTVLAAGQGSGIVRLGGEIIDTACTLDTGSAFQIIEMDPAPVGRLIREGEGDPHPFTLRLVGCSLTRYDPDHIGERLPDWQHVRVTFEGEPDREGRSFAATGPRKGLRCTSSMRRAAKVCQACRCRWFHSLPPKIRCFITPFAWSAMTNPCLWVATARRCVSGWSITE